MRGIGSIVYTVLIVMKVLNGSVVAKKAHLSCTNIPYFSAIVDVVKSEPDVVAIQKVFPYKGDVRAIRCCRVPLTRGQLTKKCEVDVVSMGGACWIKVKAMKPEAIQLIHQGNAAAGAKSVAEVSKAMLACAAEHPFHYTPPRVVIVFTHGITIDVCNDLREIVPLLIYVAFPVLIAP